MMRAAADRPLLAGLLALALPAVLGCDAGAECGRCLLLIDTSDCPDNLTWSGEATFASLMMKIARGNVANTAALDASGHPAPLRWLASKDALLHPDADERMTIPALIEHCAIESLARASAREVGSGRGGGSIMSAVV